MKDKSLWFGCRLIIRGSAVLSSFWSLSSVTRPAAPVPVDFRKKVMGQSLFGFLKSAKLVSFSGFKKYLKKYLYFQNYRGNAKQQVVNLISQRPPWTTTISHISHFSINLLVYQKMWHFFPTKHPAVRKQTPFVTFFICHFHQIFPYQSLLTRKYSQV